MVQTKQHKTLRIMAIVLFIAVIAFTLLYCVFAPQPLEGTKTITIQVVDDKQNTTTYETHTDAQYLRQAMEETRGLTFTGTEGQYGLMITAINGLRADWDKDHAWWSIYVNDQLGNYSVDSQVVSDGDVFRLQYTVENNT